MTKTYRILSVVLAVVMLLSVLPMTVNAETISGTCGDDLVWEFDDATETLTISGTGKMNNYGLIIPARPWDDIRHNVKTIIIEYGVTSVGSYAFTAFDCVTFVSIPETVTKIGYMAFSGCTSLECVVIPQSITEIGASTFSNSSNITDIYYTGSQKQWSEIVIKDFNEPILNATVHFNYHLHIDADFDEICDTCGKSTTECNHLCHESGLFGFFWDIALFFNKLFGINKYCGCGAAHY